MHLLYSAYVLGLSLLPTGKGVVMKDRESIVEHPYVFFHVIYFPFTSRMNQCARIQQTSTMQLNAPYLQRLVLAPHSHTDHERPVLKYKEIHILSFLDLMLDN